MRLVRVYKSPRKQDMYLFVDSAEALDRVPPVLLESFGEPDQVMMLKLTSSRTLARADAAQVLREIDHSGYYLQLPPAVDEAPRES